EHLRDALLAAVGHDLRSPLASATAAVSSLRSPDIQWSGQEREELLATAEESLGRLARLVADLLDLSRLRAGVLTVASEPVWLDEVIPPALDELGLAARDVRLNLPEDVPPVLADAALLTRALVNVTGNALRYSPEGRPPTVAASADGDRVQLRVIDRGPGIPSMDLQRVFTPFQRLGDTDNRAGLGLGLALSRGLVEAMGGTLEAEDTPGGGLTMVLTLPVAAVAPDVQPAEPGQRERQAP
ncbi:MAG: ATP-binding protein, partial [Kineosporiaceae bacterium]